MKYFLLSLSLLVLASCVPQSKDAIVTSDKSYPERNRKDILKKWGYPAEVFLRKNDAKLGDYVITWVYYLQNDQGDPFPIFYNFREGQSLATNAFMEPKTYYRVMNTDKLEDLKLILAERERIKKTWPVWPE